MSVLLDTHVWVWWLTARSPLPARERDALDALAGRRDLCLSAISLWEAQMLHSKARLEIPLALADWLEQAADERMLTVLPLDTAVVLALESLPRSFHGDPADRLIVATARSRRMPLATHDAAIRRSRAVPLWKA
ncbi:MAG: twitching motility protein PilT [Betaproteobacteria bacterium RBG_16_66_20]|nr:MAG: twitching motility protein PilT [Betaproteobacteria bacterium RBG_16_66_20]